jgi:pimeloyl-ACP methyl ester carboxylesterase
MKKIFFLLCLSAKVSGGFCQDITGNWQGTLEVKGASLPIVFHFKKDSADKWLATFDSPVQKAYNLACSEVIIKEDSVIIMIKMINGNYSGKYGKDKKEITGMWKQGGISLPLTITKTSGVATFIELIRPQTPKPPFKYKSEDVEYDNADKSVHFGATITYPDIETARSWNKKFPAVLLITGSGQQDRDETIFGHKPFAVIADYLTKNGLMVLRVDDRGTGKTRGNLSNATTADFAKDVEAGIAYLKTRDEVDPKKIGLIGHSEGGMIAPMVASRNNEIAFIILLGGPGIKIAKLMEQQSIDVAQSAGVSPVELEQFRPLYKKLLNAVIDEKDSTAAIEKGIKVFKLWQKGKPSRLVKNTTGVTNDSSLRNFVNEFVVQLKTPWFNYFIKFDPAVYLTKVHCPLLALNGEKDIQVAAKPNLAAIKSYGLKNKNFTTFEIQGLNHLFQHCTKCSVEEYGEIEESFSPGALTIIGDWIKQLFK